MTTNNGDKQFNQWHFLCDFLLLTLAPYSRSHQFPWCRLHIHSNNWIRWYSRFDKVAICSMQENQNQIWRDWIVKKMKCAALTVGIRRAFLSHFTEGNGMLSASRFYKIYIEKGMWRTANAIVCYFFIFVVTCAFDYACSDINNNTNWLNNEKAKSNKNEKEKYSECWNIFCSFYLLFLLSSVFEDWHCCACVWFNMEWRLVEHVVHWYKATKLILNECKNMSPTNTTRIFVFSFYFSFGFVARR